MKSPVITSNNSISLTQKIKAWAQELGFSACGICDTDISNSAEKLNEWLSAGFAGKMDYMGAHNGMREDPKRLLPEAKSVIMVRIDYLCNEPVINETLQSPNKAFISRYAQNKDYHKLIRKRLQKLALKIEAETGEFHYRPTADSAPIMEKPLAQKAGLGWIAKSTNLISPQSGSYFFLGSLVTSLELDLDEPFDKQHCGSCTACIDVCPTKAIIAPYQVDASRCISYLTIELKGTIPIEFREAIGNRIYGCDDCQSCCPWNKFAQTTQEPGFESTRGLKTPELLELFRWNEAEFLQKTEGSAIRRIGHERWLRNIAVALGNAPTSDAIVAALREKLTHPSVIVREHATWALYKSCNAMPPAVDNSQ